MDATNTNWVQQATVQVFLYVVDSVCEYQLGAARQEGA